MGPVLVRRWCSQRRLRERDEARGTVPIAVPTKPHGAFCGSGDRGSEVTRIGREQLQRWGILLDAQLVLSSRETRRSELESLWLAPRRAERDAVTDVPSLSARLTRSAVKRIKFDRFTERIVQRHRHAPRPLRHCRLIAV